uniref:Pentacotripeptide-repeat region of PRORP domain-containing protein n=1 Tax=Fagus sylvatica TaxID=28930 RepID=A0A2N9HU38_FAGSY
MSLRSSTSHIRCTLWKAGKAANRVLSRAPMTHAFHSDIDPEDDFVCSIGEIFCHGEKLSRPVDLGLLAQFQTHGSLLTPHVLNKFMSFCAKFGFFHIGIQGHSIIIKMGFVSNVYICSALVDMYGKCGAISSARKVFDEMPQKNVVTWNSLISGYLNVGCPGIAVDLFLEMLRAGIAPTPFSVSAVLVGCPQLEDGGLGTQVHGLSLKAGFCYNVVVGTGLVDMYSKCCSVNDSRRLFDQMSDKNIISWSSIITGYAQNQQPDEAVVLVKEMLRLDLKPNHVTYNSLLSSFSSPNYLDHCKQIHCRIIQDGLESDAYIVVTLAIAYSECGSSLEDFKKISSSVTRWDQISWNAVIAGFSNLGDGEEALKCFFEMRQAGVEVDFFTFTSILKAVGIISDLKEGKQVHALVFKSRYAANLYVQNGLVSMYARCGAIDDSKRVFVSMDRHDVISWNALLSGCAHHGHGRETVQLFEQMRRTHIRPDNTTFLAVLTACSHAGLQNKGLEYFNLMKNDDFLEPPTMEHYATIVDLFGRAGNLHEAEAFINSMPIKPGRSVYKALLSACQVHGNKEIALRSVKKLLELCPNDPATYVLLSNVLVTGGNWDDASKVRKLMCDTGVRKAPGYSWI